MLLQAGLRSEMGTLLSRPLLAGADYLMFSSEARTWILFIALVLFILAVPRTKAAAVAGRQALRLPCNFTGTKIEHWISQPHPL